MKYIYLVAIALFISCSGVKNATKSLNSGNYDQAINKAVAKLRVNRTSKKNQPFVHILETAFEKALDRDMKRISFLKQSQNKAYLEEIYETYQKLERRQQLISPLLPLRDVKSDRVAQFQLNDYTRDIINSKNDLVAYLYNKSIQNLQVAQTKNDFRVLYDDLRYLDQISPEYKDVRMLLPEIYEKGINYVLVNVQNKSDKIISKGLKADLVNFDSYGISDIWTVYHNKALDGKVYDGKLDVIFEQINISPERVHQKDFIHEKQIVVKEVVKKDANGKEMKDSKGKKIVTKIYQKVRYNYHELHQLKKVNVAAKAILTDLRNNQVIKRLPLNSEYQFEHIYAYGAGDKRALTDLLLGYLNNKEVPFPSNEQMVYWGGERVKAQIKKFLNSKPI